MKVEAGLDHAITAALVAMVSTGGVAFAAFAFGAPVPDVVLPAALAAGVVVVWRRARHRTTLPAMSDRDTRWCAAAAMLLVATTAILAWGALATPSRFWDGAAMWDVKAALLAATPSLEQPTFRDPAVHCHSRDYPLLQPVLQALLERSVGCGRALFPVLYALQCGVLFVAMRRLGSAATTAALVAVAWGVTPMVLNPTSGGIDSGYADALLALAVTTMVAGLAIRDHVWLVAGIALGVWVKPEGLVYGGLVVAAAWLGPDRVVLRTAAWTWFASAGVWAIVQRDLQTLGRGSVPWALLLALAVVAGLLPRVHARLGTVRARIAVGVGVALLLLVLGAANAGSGTWAAYVGDPQRVLGRLTSVPTITAELFGSAVTRGQFGLLFVLPLGFLLARGGAPDRRWPWQWLVAAALVVHAPFLLAPLDDLSSHLRATMPRLLFHHLGVAALAAGLLVDGLRSRAGEAHA